ncbi:MAG: (Fe-S)-binding protein [Syntrophales bacterium]|nr:(Fe-S)-binding protein [Syntrophales bacterium]
MVDVRLDGLVKNKGLFQCLECGKCATSCPRCMSGKEYSPRLLAHKVIAEREDEAFIENAVWECLTCDLCSERCPSGVDFSGFVIEMRTLLAETKGLKGYRAHDGAVHSWMRMMTVPELKQNRLGWINEDLKVSSTGEIAYFVGCAPYFDVFFSGIEVNTLAISRDSVRILNFFDVEPVVLADERCCGHDLLCTGDRKNFEILCRLNYEAFKDAGVKEIVFSCPECYYVWKEFMPQVCKGFDLKVTLLLDLIEREVNRGGMTFSPFSRRVTYQDPCRLARMVDKVEVPRKLLRMIPQLRLVEMEHFGHGAVCCGNSAFINCDAYSKFIQIKRLKEARATKAQMMVTSCPKCMIHLTCAMRDKVRGGEWNMELVDIHTILAREMGWFKG